MKQLHRVVMEVLLGRELRTDEHVHHIDGNTHNNHPSNLQVLSASCHSVLTLCKQPLVGYCPWCGKPYLQGTRGHPKADHCSLACAARHRYQRDPGHVRRASLARWHRGR